jgi:hypothetical protein
MGGRTPSGFLHGRRPKSSSGCCVGNRLSCCHANWGSLPPVSPPGVRRFSTQARKRCKNHHLLATIANAPVYAKNWAKRPWKLSCCTKRSDGSKLTALYGPGGRDDEPGHRALHRQAVWPGAGLPWGGHGARHRLLAAATRARGLPPAGGPLAPVRMTNWWPTFGASWRHRPSPAKATARYGPGCGIVVSVRRRAGSCA